VKTEEDVTTHKLSVNFNLRNSRLSSDSSKVSASVYLFQKTPFITGWDRVVGIATVYGLDDRGVGV
jgi:hypothetical protein